MSPHNVGGVYSIIGGELDEDGGDGEMSSLPEYCSESEGIVTEDSVKGLIRSSEDIAGFGMPYRRRAIQRCSLCACQLDVDVEWRCSRVEAFDMAGICRARLRSSGEQRGDVLGRAAFTRSLCQFDVNFNHLLFVFATKRSFANISTHLKDKLRPSHNNVAIMDDDPNHIVLINEFCGLTGISPSLVSTACSARPNVPLLIPS
jgi:hypothetical protein